MPTHFLHPFFFRSPQRFVGGSGWWSRSLSSVKKTTSATRRERILYSFFDIFLFEIVEQLEDKGEKRKREKQEKE